MRKVLAFGVAAIFAVVLAAVVAGVFVVNPLVRKGAEHFGPQFLGAEVRLARSDLSLLRGQGELRGLFVGNPQGFTTPGAFSADAVRVQFDTRTLLDRTVVVRAVVVESPIITYEVTGRVSNLQTLVDNVTRSAGAGSGGDGGSGAGSGGDGAAEGGRRVVIENLVIRGGRVNFAVSGFGGEFASVPLGDIHLRNIGGDDSTMADAVREVLVAVNAGVADKVPDAVRDGAGRAANVVKGALESVGESIRGLFK
ncbi:hypothetical protein GGQ74_002572 [Desulfobaculum xiamenense]|uniref:AsmA family protein n=1 Tax=Desulfobaculum xiamenense TaxID=995050 RepID=A0A846QW96_9BACT|nr:hypothetical protein [Desulfobaculum xiamenense]NJB68899.1 hypothetical protein [Desulfobaculum xiamenense]